jgi:NADPH:quinone reductase-like Zn-dependent oxidoreductase
MRAYSAAVVQFIAAPRSSDQARRRRGGLNCIEQVQYRPGDHEELAPRALAEMAAGRITPVIGQTFPLERAADAHARWRPAPPSARRCS